MEPKNLRVSPVLTDTSIGYRTDMFSFIAHKIFPDVFVNKRSGKIVTYTADAFRIEKSLASHNSPAKEVDINVSIGDHFDIELHKLKAFVSKREMQEADKPIRPKMDKTEALTGKLLLEYEKTVADVLRNPSVITQTSTPSNLWSNTSTSNPFVDIKTGVNAIKSSTGISANTGIMGWDVLQALLIHPEVRARFPGASEITYDMIAAKLASLFGLKNLWIGDAPYNTANPGQADSLSQIWAEDFIIAYVESEPKEKSRSLGKTYRLRSEGTRKVKEWASEDPEGTYVKVEDEFDVKLIDNNCAYLLDDVL